MKTRRLGHSPINITEIGLGTNYIGGHNLYDAVDEDQGIRLVQQAVDLGITFIDTADAYGNGRSEELIGIALKDRWKKVVIATKGGITLDGTSTKEIDNDPAYLRRALVDSLRRLGRDYVDLYYIHKPDGITPPEEAFGALLRFKEEGLIRAAGVSNFELPALKAAMKAGPVDALQSRFNLLQREVATEILPFCEENGISFIPWGPLAYGLLGGKYTLEFKLSASDWRHDSGVFDPGLFERNLAIVERLKRLAEKRKVALTHLAIQWLLSKPAVGSVIAGAKRADQVEQNAQADSLELTPDDISEIDSIVE